MTADSSRSVRTIHQPLSNLPIQIESESEVELKSLDRITNLRPKELPVHLPEPRKGLPKNVNEPHLQTVLLKALYLQIFVVTPRTTTSTPSDVGSKKEAGLEEISSKTAA